MPQDSNCGTNGPGADTPDHLHPHIGKGPELRAEEQHEAHVDGGDMDQLLPGQRAQRARATCIVDVADGPVGFGDVEHRAPELGPLAEPVAQFRIGSQPLHGLDQQRGVAGRDEEGVDLVLEDLGHASDYRSRRSATRGWWLPSTPPGVPLGETPGRMRLRRPTVAGRRRAGRGTGTDRRAQGRRGVRGASSLSGPRRPRR